MNTARSSVPAQTKCPRGRSPLVTVVTGWLWFLGLESSVPAQTTVAPAELAPSVTRTEPVFVLGGYVEAFYQWNVNAPVNGVTNFRGFDNRHNAFTVSNAVLDAQWQYHGVSGRLAVQVGHTPSTYFQAEPVISATDGASASSPELWKYLQQALVGYRIPLGRGLDVQAGIFLSPIGPESMVVHDNVTWSRSNLFFGLPFYHTGLRLTYPVTTRWSLTAAVVNGWNSVVDNNQEKSFYVQALHQHADHLTLSILYFSGVERAPAASERTGVLPWRHLLDLHATYLPHPRLTLIGQLNGGVEPVAMGTAGWGAGALSAQVKAHRVMAVAVRGDFFREWRAADGLRQSAPIFWPTSWLLSGTLTLDVRPVEGALLRLEYRHDQAADAVFFRADSPGNGLTQPFQPSAASQDTLTLGLSTWF